MAQIARDQDKQRNMNGPQGIGKPDRRHAHVGDACQIAGMIDNHQYDGKSFQIIDSFSLFHKVSLLSVIVGYHIISESLFQPRSETKPGISPGPD